MILVLGMGITGLSIAKFLNKKNIKFRIADNREYPPLLSQFTTTNIHLGKWRQSILENINKIIISPGIAQNEDIIKWAQQLKIKIISDIDLFCQYTNSIIIGVTGSNGKSTVTKMLEFVINFCGKNAIACGNIGVPVLDALSPKIDIYVIELSSYQLDYSNITNLDFGVVLNITPDHLDRYDDFADYVNAKLKIYKISKTNIINLDNSYCHAFKGIGFTSKNPQNNDFGISKYHGSSHFVQNDKVLFSFDETQLLGAHNIENILSVLTITQQLNLPLNQSIQAIKRFKNLPHRLEFVNTINTKKFFNDSKATNSIATICAINAIYGKYQNITLILGGIQKEENYTALFNLVNQKIKNTLLFGASTQFFKQNIKNAKITNNLENAVKLAKSLNNEVVLFSPACASFDEFDNFMQRGEKFKQWVNHDN